MQGLGAPVHKLIMTVPAFASAFNLADPARNMPGSAVTGPPVAMTYQKVEKKFLFNPMKNGEMLPYFFRVKEYKKKLCQVKNPKLRVSSYFHI